MSASAGRYRIQAVAKMTGVTTATLRAWERRYGVPSPGRTHTSYRLYSDGDVDMIRQLRDLCRRGMAPAEAARAVLAAARGMDKRAAVETDPFCAARGQILTATAELDDERLDRAVRETLMLGPAHLIVSRVIEPALAEIGERWARDELTIAHEHLASSVLGTFARELLRLVQPPDSAPAALLACVAHETHVMPLYGVGFRLAQVGFRSVLLGARTPPAALETAVSRLAPGLIGLSWTVRTPDGEPAALIADYARACGETPWIVGGRQARQHLPAIERAGGLPAPEDPSDLFAALLDTAVGSNRPRNNHRS